MSKKHTSQAHATYTRGILTIDLPRAKEPVLWRQEIKDISRISFSLQTLANGERALVLRADDGAEQIIATFDQPAAADEALAALREILLRPHSGKPWRGLLRIVKWLFILLLLWWLIQFAIHLYFMADVNKAMQEAVHTAQQTNETPTGVPLIADDYLPEPAE